MAAQPATEHFPNQTGAADAPGQHRARWKVMSYAAGKQSPPHLCPLVGGRHKPPSPHGGKAAVVALNVSR